jgi:hypothetical protein
LRKKLKRKISRNKRKKGFVIRFRRKMDVIEKTVNLNTGNILKRKINKGKREIDLKRTMGSAMITKIGRGAREKIAGLNM